MLKLSQIKRPPRKSKVSPFLLNNKDVEKAYSKIVGEAFLLLNTYEEVRHRTYCHINHALNEQNTNMVKEFLCYFCNITLYFSPHNNMMSIQIDLGKEGLEEFGNKFTRNIITKSLSVMSAMRLSHTAGNPLFINPQPLPLSHYYNRTIAQGETEYILIGAIDRN